MIKAESISFYYPHQETPALRNIDLHIKPGERVAVMGTNGSGKTTLAKIFAGLLEPSRGRLINDYPVDTIIPVGLIFQNPDNQLITLTVEKELAFTLENYGIPSDDIGKKISATLSRFDIGHLRKRLISELSGGEKQKVALASVMITDPALLILDEPDSFLDDIGRKQLKAELDRLTVEHDRLTIIHITQYLETARQYPRLLVCQNGELSGDAAPSELLDNPSFCLTHGLAAKRVDTSLNISPGILSSHQDTPSLDKIVCQDVSFGYDEQPLIKNLSLTVKRGEVLGITGPSGCGKTTLGLLLNNLLTPVSGSLDFLDDKNQSMSPDKTTGKVSMVFQQAERQFFLSTVGEEIKYGPKNFGVTLNANIVKEILNLLDLSYTDFVHRDPLTLSGGELRRLAIGTILALRPDFIVFDEPTCGLDIPATARFTQLIRLLADGGIGIILISHHHALINALADRILAFSNNTQSLHINHPAGFMN